MRLVLFDLETEPRECFYPLALSRPIWDLRCGMTSLGEKLIARTDPAQVAGFLPGYMADAYRESSSWPINDPASLGGDDLLLVDARLKVDALDIESVGPSQVGVHQIATRAILIPCGIIPTTRYNQKQDCRNSNQPGVHEMPCTQRQLR